MTNFPQVCIIGAGFGGICAAIQLRKQVGIDSYDLFEKSEDVGGVWLVNKYPGAKCDIPSHLYSYSFKPNPNWTSYFASQPEILEYIQSVASKYNVYPRIQFKTIVKVLRWDEELSKWRVTVCNGNGSRELLYDIVINANGQFRNPKIPKEFLPFQGKMMHSAEWDSETSLVNKTVAVVGSGASAVQIIPAIAPLVKTLHVFNRRPAWILPAFNFYFPEWCKILFAVLPPLMWIFRLYIFLMFEALLPCTLVHGSLSHRFAVWIMNSYRGFCLRHKPHLNEKLAPNYTYGCKNLFMGDTYYGTFCRDNVTVCNDPITGVESNSIITAKEAFTNIDVLVLATGFDVQDYFAPLKIIGRDGINLLEFWKDNRPSMFYGVVCKEAPNFFALVGPGSFPTVNSAVLVIETQTSLIMKVIKELGARGSKVACIKPRAEAEYMTRYKSNIKRLVTGNVECGSWYVNDRGEVTSPWPSSLTSFLYQMQRVNLDLFEFY